MLFFGKKAWGKAKVEVGEIGSKGVWLANKGFESKKVGTYGEMRDLRNNGWEVIELPDGFMPEHEVWTLPITPEMRQKALREGMPMFSKRISTEEIKKHRSTFNKEKRAFVRTLASKLPKNAPYSKA